MKLTRRGLFGLAAGAGVAAALPGAKASVAKPSSRMLELSAIDANLGYVTAGKLHAPGATWDLDSGTLTLGVDNRDMFGSKD